MMRLNILTPDGLFADLEGDSFSIIEEPQHWQVWLAQGRSFIVQTRRSNGVVVSSYVALCEQSGDDTNCEWYAHKPRDGQHVKQYLGRALDLTWERIQMVAEELK